MNSIRISGGNLKGKKIYFEFNDSLRPTSNKLREILFNWTHFELEQGFECLDLFAGTGALGFEAISRNASKVTFVELNKKHYLNIKKNILKLGLQNSSKIFFKDAFSWISKNDLSNFDLIIIDPPFNMQLEEKILKKIISKNELKKSCKIYLEFSKFSEIEIPGRLKILKEKKLGDVKALLLEI
jgi:16S rRNA (guanine966-N2)-methyltransferase